VFSVVAVVSCLVVLVVVLAVLVAPVVLVVQLVVLVVQLVVLAALLPSCLVVAVVAFVPCVSVSTLALTASAHATCHLACAEPFVTADVLVHARLLAAEDLVVAARVCSVVAALFTAASWRDSKRLLSVAETWIVHVLTELTSVLLPTRDAFVASVSTGAAVAVDQSS